MREVVRQRDALLEALERVEREARRLHVDDILDLTAARAAIKKARDLKVE